MCNWDPKYRTRKRTDENSLLSIHEVFQNLVHTSVHLTNIYSANKMKQNEQRSNKKKKFKNF